VPRDCNDQAEKEKASANHVGLKNLFPRTEGRFAFPDASKQIEGDKSIATTPPHRQNTR
jgi:hypothetical protein